MILVGAISAAWYWIIVIGYMFVLLGIGAWTYRYQKRQKTATDEHDDYWISKRRNSALVVGCAIAAGWFLMGFITWAMYNTYMFGIGGIFAMVVPWTVLLFCMVILVPHVRRFKAISQPQMLQQRFGLGLRVAVSPFNMFCFIIWAAAEIWTVSIYIAPEFGVEPWVLYFVFAVPVALYMAMGGFHAVISANLLQFAMGVTFVTILFIVMIVRAWDALPAGQGMYDYLGSVTPPGNAEGESALSWFSLGIPFAIFSLIALLPGWVIEEDWWLKAQSAHSTHAARQGIWANLVYNIVWILAIPSVIGILGLALYPPAQFDKLMGGDAYQLMPLFLANYVPTGLQLVVFCLMAGHAIATVATFTNVSALNIGYDVLQPLVYRPRGWDDARVVLAGRFASFGVVIATLGVTFLIDLLPRGLWDAYYLSSGVLSAAVGITVLAMFWKRATYAGALAATIVGGVATLVLYLVEKYVWEYDWPIPVPQVMIDTYYAYAVAGVILAVIVLVIVTLLTPKPPQASLDAIAAEPVDDHAEFFAGVRETY
jgi:SSS family solute:Na+ symporter